MPRMHEALGSARTIGHGANHCNLSTQEAETGGEVSQCPSHQMRVTTIAQTLVNLSKLYFLSDRAVSLK